jgi:RNA recognition motif-containing protein
MVPYNHVMMPQAWAYPAAVGLESRARALHHAAATLQAQVQAASATAKSKRKSKAATKRASDKTVPSERTTILLKNLHSSLTRSALLNLLDSAGFSCKYDFVYLPFKLVPNAEVQSIFGYAIVNFCSAADASAAMECLRGVQIESQEVITEWSESQQGHEVLVQRYRDSPVMHESMPEEYQPILLLNGARVEFPAPTRPLQPSRKFAEKK